MVIRISSNEGVESGETSSWLRDPGYDLRYPLLGIYDDELGEVRVPAGGISYLVVQDLAHTSDIVKFSLGLLVIKSKLCLRGY